MPYLKHVNLIFTKYEKQMTLVLWTDISPRTNNNVEVYGCIDLGMHNFRDYRFL